MKRTLLIPALLLSGGIAFGQASGNINYLNNNGQNRIAESNIDVYVNHAAQTITVKGMANLKADSYVAIFSATQTGPNLEEVNNLMDNRIEMIKKRFEGNADVTFFTDMISFVPVYEYEVDKKIFNKKTYNEVPKGFELKMNIHVKYKKADLLSKIVSACSESEVYDLVRVDYFSTQMEQVKKDLAARSKTMLKEKIKSQQELLGMDFTTLKKHVADAYKVNYPLEMYRNYQAYANTSLNQKKTASASLAVTQVEKSTTLYYQPVIDKEFDFVVNPEILEPVIQVMYEVSFVVVMPEDRPADKTKEYMLIKPTGEIAPLDLK